MTLDNQIDEVKNNYPRFAYDPTKRLFTGVLNIDHTFNDEHIIGAYEIEIYVPQGIPRVLPVVKMLDRTPQRKREHINQDGSLCVATYIEQHIFFSKGNKLADWIEHFVVPFFFSAEYFAKYGLYPFGEREHGGEGTLEAYVELFNVSNSFQALSMLEYIVAKRYRGHNWCPCGSGQRIRNCHDVTAKKWMDDENIVYLVDDYRQIKFELARRNNARQNF